LRLEAQAKTVQLQSKIPINKKIKKIKTLFLKFLISFEIKSVLALFLVGFQDTFINSKINGKLS